MFSALSISFIVLTESPESGSEPAEGIGETWGQHLCRAEGPGGLWPESGGLLSVLWPPMGGLNTVDLSSTSPPQSTVTTVRGHSERAQRPQPCLLPDFSGFTFLLMVPVGARVGPTQIL